MLIDINGDIHIQINDILKNENIDSICLFGQKMLDIKIYVK